MASIPVPKVIGNGSKQCKNKECGKIKPFSEFYVRSGYGTLEHPALLPGHFVTECIDCMKERGKKPKPKEPWVSLVESENIAIEAFMAHGVGAVTGKSANAPDFDLMLWGWIGAEVKHATVQNKRGESQSFTFNTTPKQQERGFLAHIVVLICEWPDGHMTFHLFDAKEPYFYRPDGRVKSGLTFTPDIYRKGPSGRVGHHALTQAVMDAHKDKWSLVGQYLLKLSNQLRNGARPVYGKPLDVAA